MFGYPPKKPGVDVSKGERGQPAGTYNKGAPVVAKQNARMYGGYTGGLFRQKNPAPVAYLNNHARTFGLPLAIRQRMRAPAQDTEMFVSDPRMIVGSVEAWEAKEAYFRNMHLRDLGGVRVNPERTPSGTGRWGKPYEPAGNTFRFLPNPDTGADSNEAMPLRRGY